MRIVEANVWVSVLNDSKLTSNTLKLGKDFAHCLGLTVGSLVECHGDSKFVNTWVGRPIVLSPVSIDDYEVVDSMSVFLEESILDQVRVICPRLNFPVWIARGQKPVFLTVREEEASEEYYLLGPNTELAIESRKRILDDQQKSTSAPIFRLVENDLLFQPGEKFHGVGFIVGSHVGESMLVSVRDRPEIVCLCVLNGNLCDPGIAIVSPVLRDMYGLHGGNRIGIEEFTDTVIHPAGVAIWTSSVADTSIGLFQKYVEKVKCVIVPQGGWVGPIDELGYVQIRYTINSLSSSTHKDACVISWSRLSEIQITTHTLNGRLERTANVLPFLKYIPLELHVFGLFTEIPVGQCLNKEILPSFRLIVESLAKYIESSFVHADPKIEFAGSALVLAPHRGCGVTTVCVQTVQQLDPPVPCIRIDCALLSDSTRFPFAHVKEALKGLVRWAFETPPCILLFDRVDLLIPSIDPNDESQIRENRRGNILGLYLEELMHILRPNRSIFLLGTTTNDSPLLGKIFIHSAQLPRDLSVEDRVWLGDDQRTGYTLCELFEIRKFGVDNREKRRNFLSANNKKTILASKKSVLGGMKLQKIQLLDTVSLPLKWPSLFNKPGLVASGALVVGPTGCGKSALVDWVVAESGLPVEIVRGPDLLDKYIGASEMAVRRVFEKAASIAPSIVVFDAIEALCPRRGSESTGVTDRVVNQMLCYLDGIDKLENVFVIAITSRPDMVDPALTRPGRLDLVVVCNIPNIEEKRFIIQALADTQHLDAEQICTLAKSLHPHCTGADIKSGFANAEIDAHRNKTELNFASLLECMQKIKPSISDRDAMEYAQQLARYINVKPQPATTSIGTRVMLQ